MVWSSVLYTDLQQKKYFWNCKYNNRGKYLHHLRSCCKIFSRRLQFQYFTLVSYCMEIGDYIALHLQYSIRQAILITRGGLLLTISCFHKKYLTANEIMLQIAS